MRPILAALLLALVLVPPVAAAPVASVGASYVYTDWRATGFWGQCYQRAVLATEHVNSRVLLSVHSTHLLTTDTTIPQTETECALSFAIEPGVTVNPCDVPGGSVAPATTTNDPYLYLEYATPSEEIYHKRFDFPNGGHLELYYVESKDSAAMSIAGSCRSGDVSGTFSGRFDRTSVG